MNSTRLTFKRCKQIIEAFVNQDEEFFVCFELVSKFFKDDEKKIVKWFFVENPLLGNVRPIEMVMIGRTKKLLAFINNAKDEGGW